MSINKVEAHMSNNEVDEKVQLIVSKYPMLFDDSIGNITGFQARLQIRPQTTPRFVKARRVPIALTEVLEKELQRQVYEGILAKVYVYAVTIKLHLFPYCRWINTPYLQWMNYLPQWPAVRNSQKMICHELTFSLKYASVLCSSCFQTFPE